VICSRFPIIETAIHPYSLNGAPIDVLGGDWMAGKALASVVVEHPTLGEVQVFNTHVTSRILVRIPFVFLTLRFQLFAKGGDEAPDQFKAHLLANAWEFSKLVLQAAQLGRHVIAVRRPVFPSFQIKKA
jgi:sphingomyelin phosphodiesterase 2